MAALFDCLSGGMINGLFAGGRVGAWIAAHCQTLRRGKYKAAFGKIRTSGKGSSLCAHIRHQWKRKYNCHVGKCTKGSMASEEVVARCLSQVRMAIEELQEEGWDSIVEFDAVTTAALLWYAQEKCDIVCLETGLGGRLDTTNAVQNTLVACIMSIGKDHTELLGDTYEKIAFEKCGILKNDCAAVIYPGIGRFLFL